MWAEVSEKSSDDLDPTIKYGGGSDWWRDRLTKISQSVAAYENLEKVHSKAFAAYEVMVAAHEKFKKATSELLEHHLPEHEVQEIRGKLEDSTRKMERAEQKEQESRADMVRRWNETAACLTEEITQLDKLKGQKQ